MLYLCNSFPISLALINVRQEGRGNCTTIQRMTQPLKIQQKPKQLGPRWQKIQLPVHLEPHYTLIVIHPVCFISVPQLLPTLCDPMDCRTPGFPAYQQLPELTQTHVHQVFDAIQPSHPLSSPPPPAFNLS